MDRVDDRLVLCHLLVDVELVFCDDSFRHRVAKGASVATQHLVHYEGVLLHFHVQVAIAANRNLPDLVEHVPRGGYAVLGSWVARVLRADDTPPTFIGRG